MQLREAVTPPAASAIAYTWDDNGNLTDRGADEFSWDYEDRMVEATVNAVTTTFAYRGDGLRDSRTGNPATVGDPAWTPLLPATPNHPEYPSAHSCLTPAAARVIARFLGTEEIQYTVPSLTGLGDRYYPDADALVEEVSNARIWAGIHFRSAVEDGVRIARRTANEVLSQHFRPAH